jgi:hypothetical protein
MQQETRREFLKAGLILSVGCWVERHNTALAAERNGEASPDHVANEAERVIHGTRHTKYQHKAYIDEATGTYYVDCSDYASYVLGRVAKHHLDMIPRESWWPVPRAYKYYDYFQSLPSASGGWRKIEQVMQVRRGDIIAWKSPGPVQKDHDTGHVFVVAETPSAVDLQTFAVRAYDSSNLKHYDDSRVQENNTMHDGVGIGTIHFQIDANGRPKAFQFGPGDHFHEYPIAIGRVETIRQITADDYNSKIREMTIS